MRKKILVIDDSITNLLLIESIFEGDNKVEVFIESDGTNAIKTIKTLLPDLIILDIIMPDFDGFQILSELERIKNPKQIPVIICTSLDGKMVEERISKSCANDYIRKPINIDMVYSKVMEYL
jgi:CheY-like chemotaxis protein